VLRTSKKQRHCSIDTFQAAASDHPTARETAHAQKTQGLLFHCEKTQRLPFQIFLQKGAQTWKTVTMTLTANLRTRVSDQV
jgi:hypothetical protein